MSHKLLGLIIDALTSRPAFLAMSGHAALPRPFALLVLLMSVAPRACMGLLSPAGSIFSAKFEPPYDDSSLQLQLDVVDWWTAFSDTAVLAKGTKIPILVDACATDVSACRSWTVPGDVTLQIGTPTNQAAHSICERCCHQPQASPPHSVRPIFLKLCTALHAHHSCLQTFS